MRALQGKHTPQRLPAAVEAFLGERGYDVRRPLPGPRWRCCCEGLGLGPTGGGGGVPGRARLRRAPAAAGRAGGAAVSVLGSGTVTLGSLKWGVVSARTPCGNRRVTQVVQILACPLQIAGVAGPGIEVGARFGMCAQVSI